MMLKQLFSYSAALWGIGLAASFVRLGLRALIAKTAGMEAMGAFAFYGTAITIGGAIVALGLKRALTKVVAAGNSEADFVPLIAAVMTALLTITMLSWLAGWLLAPWLGWVYLLAIATCGPATIVELARSAFRGQLDKGREVRLLAGTLLAQVICVLAAMALFGGPRAPAWGAATANLLSAAGVIAYFISRNAPAWHPATLQATFRSAGFASLTSLSVPLWLAELIGLISQYAEQVILQGSLGYAAIATYAAALTFIGVLDQMLTILSRVSLVAFAGAHYTEVTQYRTGISFNLLFVTVLGLCMAALSIPLTPIVFTEEYVIVPSLVAILSLSFVFQAALVLNSSLTIARDFAGANRDAALGCAIVTLPVALVLVPAAGAVGAAWSYTLAWIIYTLIHASLMRKQLPLHATASLRLTLSIACLYGLGVAAIAWTASSWSLAVVLPILLLAGHGLRVWNLADLPRLGRALLAGRS